jgi:hypothetical protein
VIHCAAHLRKRCRVQAYQAFAQGDLLVGEDGVIDHVPEWFLQGHRKAPTGRSAGRQKGAKDSFQRSYRRKYLPAHI